MLIESQLDPKKLHEFVHEYREHFSAAELDFLINMLVACDLNQEISQRQWAWLEALIRRISIMIKMERDY